MSLLIRLLEISQELTAFGYHLEKPATRMKVLLVLLEVSRQLLDRLGKKGDLVLRGTRVLIVSLHRLSYLLLLLVRQRHTIESAICSSFQSDKQAP